MIYFIQFHSVVLVYLRSQLIHKCLLLCCFLLLILSCKKEQAVMVTANYNYVIVDHNFTVPVRVDFANSSKGAEHHRWTFEGGTPALSTKKDPGIITFCNAGAHRVTLEVWNDDDRQIKTTTLQLDSAVSTGFDARVRINNFAPAQVQIANKTIGATSYQWTFEGGDPSIKYC